MGTADSSCEGYGVPGGSSCEEEGVSFRGAAAVRGKVWVPGDSICEG